MVNEDCLKLTSYFGERSRVGGRFYADAVMDVYGAHEVAASIMVRGAAGFGLKHHLRTDQSLTLSEDLPVATIAVDTRSRIEALLDDITGMHPAGLTVLERARMLQHDVGPEILPEQLHEGTKLTIYIGRQERVFRMPAYQAVCRLLHRRGIAGATVLLGVDGTVHRQRQRARFFGRNADVPMMIMTVGDGERISRVLPELGGLLERPLLTLERVRICKRDGRLFERPHALPETDERGLQLWQKLTVYSSESALHEGMPIHRALVQRLRRSGTARGATVLRGMWGFHGDHRPHGDRMLQLSRHVPTVTVVIDRPGNIAASFDIVDELTRDHGLVTTEMVPALTATDGHGNRRGGTTLADHDF
ncbi:MULTISPECIES: DUF190 domain-containing protein [Amycolatopsis]|uniref:DUF190 domain-containing protein n=1 Tax=Amycolatopsis TaxID=1813 RepID=UPI001E40EC29|nr:DUF190 domain-containing protein [Amycolatopsis sp. M39]